MDKQRVTSRKWWELLTVVATVWALWNLLVAVNSGKQGRLLLAAAHALTALALPVCLYALRRQKSWAWTAVVALPLLWIARDAPMIPWNVFMFASGNQLYEDSPATIFIIGMAAVPLVLLPAAVVVTAVCGRKYLLGQQVHHDLDFLTGSWTDDPEVDSALEEQQQIDPELWR